MLAFDLCGGSGGWAAGLMAAGFTVIGFDIEDHGYPGHLVFADVRILQGTILRGLGASLIVASPPCDEFSRHDQPWTKKRNPPDPDKSIWLACERIAAEAGLPLVLENVRGAQKFMGSAVAHYGSTYLWGAVPAVLPYAGHDRQKQSRSSSARLARARVPFPLALHIGRCYAGVIPPEDVNLTA